MACDRQYKARHRLFIQQIPWYMLRVTWLEPQQTQYQINKINKTICAYHGIYSICLCCAKRFVGRNVLSFTNGILSENLWRVNSTRNMSKYQGSFCVFINTVSVAHTLSCRLCHRAYPSGDHSEPHQCEQRLGLHNPEDRAWWVKSEW